jgi:hypothetical protein
MLGKDKTTVEPAAPPRTRAMVACMTEALWVKSAGVQSGKAGAKPGIPEKLQVWEVVT